jgi:hypothetical protein
MLHTISEPRHISFDEENEEVDYSTIILNPTESTTTVLDVLNYLLFVEGAPGNQKGIKVT